MFNVIDGDNILSFETAEIMNEAVISYTDEEKAATAKKEKIELIDRELTKINLKQTRSSAEIINALIMNEDLPIEAVKRHKEREARAEKLRAERNEFN
jgi:hypothetical protein